MLTWHLANFGDALFQARGSANHWHARLPIEYLNNRDREDDWITEVNA